MALDDSGAQLCVVRRDVIDQVAVDMHAKVTYRFDWLDRHAVN